MARPYGSGRMPLAEHLSAKAIRRPNGCLDFIGPRNRKGYGAIGIGGRDGVTIGAHRAAWICNFGPIPSGMLICHHCDNPSCIEPGHLFIGTASDNANDKVSKGRAKGCPGENHPNAKLNADKVKAIRSAYSAGNCTTRRLAAEYNVSCVCIYNIVSFKTWKDVR